MTHHCHTARCDDGFTLLELLVAMALVAIIAVYLSSYLSFGRRIWQQGVSFEQSGQVDAIQRALRSRLETARPSVDGSAAPLEGSEQSVRFVSALPATTQVAGLYEIGIESEPRSDGKLRLLFQQSLQRAGATVERHLMLDGVSAIKLRYYGPRQGDRESSWHDEWKGEPSLPQLVSLAVSFPEGDSRRWPTLIAELIRGRARYQLD